MDDSFNLPEDTAAWPTNPYALLNVPENISRSQLRRTYHKLIRRFKPEQYPEEFRRIREAYEAVLRHVEFNERYPVDDESTGTDDAASVETSSDAPTLPPVRVVVEDPLQTWRGGIDGDAAALYSALQAKLNLHRDDAQLYAQLAWLLRAAPDVDPDLQPNDWLVGGLIQTSQTDTLVELYRRELRCNDGEALGERAHRLFKISPPRRWLVILARVRWHRAVHHNQSEVILSDLEAYDCASRPFADRDLAWQIESTAMRALWLFRSPSVESYTEARMRKLEEEFGHDPQFYDMLAWLDTSRELARAWQAARERSYPAHLLAMLIQVDTCEYGELRTPLLNWLARTSQGELYRIIERLVMEAPLLLSQFQRLLDEAEGASLPTEPVEWPMPLLASVVFEFMERNASQLKAADFHLKILDFCLANAASPSTIAEAMETQQSRLDPVLRKLISDLRQHVCLNIAFRARMLLQT